MIPATRSRWKGWVALGWMGYGTLGTIQTYLVLGLAGRQPIVWYGPAVANYAHALFWIAVTPGLVALADRWPVRGTDRARNILLHVVAAFVVSVADIGLEISALWVIRGARTTPVLQSYIERLDVILLYYAAVVLIAHTVRYYRLSHERALRSATLSAEVSRARLQVLRDQLRPHFLFNTLNSISGLLRDQPDAADRMIEGLSTLLRRNLELGEASFVPMATELEVLRLYADIQHARHADWLRFRFRIEPGTERVPVPPFLLQPIVENAIRHGLSPVPDGGTVTVSVRTAAGRLHLVVEDDGAGLADGPPGGGGIGLANTRRRLSEIYGADYALSVTPARPRGCRVELVLPMVRPADTNGPSQPAEVLEHGLPAGPA